MTGKKRGRPKKKKSSEETKKPVAKEPEAMLTPEQIQMKESLIDILTEEARLDEMKAIELGEKYINISNFAKAIRSGEDLGIDDEAKNARVRLIGLSH